MKNQRNPKHIIVNIKRTNGNNQSFEFDEKKLIKLDNTKNQDLYNKCQNQTKKLQISLKLFLLVVRHGEDSNLCPPRRI